MSSHDKPSGGHRLFDDEENALATCEAALQWLQRYRDAHGGVFPERIFNALIRLRPSCSPEVIVHKLVDGEAFFWLTLRAVDEADPFNGMWHYTGSVDRCGDYLIGGIRRVLQRELGGGQAGKLPACGVDLSRAQPPFRHFEPPVFVHGCRRAVIGGRRPLVFGPGGDESGAASKWTRRHHPLAPLRPVVMSARTRPAA